MLHTTPSRHRQQLETAAATKQLGVPKQAACGPQTSCAHAECPLRVSYCSKNAITNPAAFSCPGGVQQRCCRPSCSTSAAVGAGIQESQTAGAVAVQLVPLQQRCDDTSHNGGACTVRCMQNMQNINQERHPRCMLGTQAAAVNPGTVQA